MFAWHRRLAEGDVTVDVAFTDARMDLREGSAGFAPALRRLEQQIGVPVARMRQVHGARVHVVTDRRVAGPPPQADALVTERSSVALMTRVADCVPVLLVGGDSGSDVGSGPWAVGAVHAGRRGLTAGVVTAAVAALRAGGTARIRAWVGPHVCGSCYEVPAQMREEVAATAPAAYSSTAWGTPALDLGAAVRAQLIGSGCAVTEVGGCTREDPQWHSHRRDGAAAGRFAGLVWMTQPSAADRRT